MKYLSYTNLIKIILVYWVCLFFVHIFFDPFSYLGPAERITETSFKLPKLYKWGQIFNFAILIPVLFAIIFKIISWRKK